MKKRKKISDSEKTSEIEITKVPFIGSINNILPDNKEYVEYIQKNRNI